MPSISIPAPSLDAVADRVTELDARPYPSFEMAIRQILTLIQQRLGVGISFVGRIDGHEWQIIGPREDLSQDDLTFVEAMARLLAFEVDRERTRLEDGREHDRLREQGERDPLTGLADRRAWDAAIAAERGRTALRETSVAFMFDMDGSEVTNDRHGHTARDANLRAFGDALRAAARASDVVARLDGDEFGVLLLGATAAAGQAFLERLRTVVERESPVVGFSVGRSLAADGDDLDQAVERADAALRAAKASRPQDLFGRVRQAY